MEDVPFFNAPVYLENKQSVGKIDEIFGNLRDYFVSVKLTTDLKASSFNVDDKVRFLGLGCVKFDSLFIIQIFGS